MKEIKNVSIIGMGALGLMYGNIIEQSGTGISVSYIMDKERVSRSQGKKVLVNGAEKSFSIVCAEDAKEADLLIVAVKSTGLKSAIESMEKAVGPDTVIISVMNGIDSEEMIGARYGYQNIIYTVAQGMDAMKFGDEFSVIHTGELRIGCIDKTDRNAYEQLKRFFEKVHIAYTEEEDILFRMWSKFMLNVGINQVCMTYGITTGEALTEGTEGYRVMIAAMREVLAISNLEGIHLTEKDLNHALVILSGISPTGMPSMAQDRVNKKYSEVESFAGTVIRIAEKHDICVPSNRYLYEKAKAIEALY